MVSRLAESEPSPPARTEPVTNGPKWGATFPTLPIVVGGSVVAILVVVVLVTMSGGGSPATEARLPSLLNKQEESPNSAAQASKSFEAMLDQAKIRLPNLKPQQLPEYLHKDFDLQDTSDMTFESELSYNPATSLTHDVTDTRSLVSPFQGTMRFGALLKGTIKGVQRGQRSDFPYSIPFEASEQVEATYDYRYNHWSLNEVKFTTSDFRAQIVYEPGGDLFSGLVAAELNKSKSRMTGAVRKFPSTTQLLLIQLLRVLEIK